MLSQDTIRAMAEAMNGDKSIKAPDLLKLVSPVDEAEFYKQLNVMRTNGEVFKNIADGYSLTQAGEARYLGKEAKAPEPKVDPPPAGDAARENLKKKLVETLILHGPMGVTKLKQLTGTGAAKSEILELLGELGPAVKKQSNGQWAAVRSQLGHTVQPKEPSPDKPTEPPAAASTPTPAPEAIDDKVREALARLDQSLHPEHQVEDLDLKCEVLDHLAALLDPTISQVLTDIQADLRGAP